MKNMKLCLGLLWFLSTAVMAQDYASTPQEEAMCSTVLKGLDAPPHYCDCPRFTQRAVGTLDATERRYNLQLAVDGCNYALGHSDPNSYMRPMVLVSKGRALELAKRPAEAIADYETAIRLNPSYYKAYIGLSDAYLAVGDRKAALQAVERGLQVAPQSTGLQKRLAKLKGS